MGHQHLGTLPQSKKWQRVVGLISGGADVRDVASAVSAAAERAMIDAANDPAVRSAFYVLTQVLLAARKEHFVPELRMLGLRVSSQPSLVEIVSAFTEAVDREVRANGGRTDFSEMVQLAATESLNAVAGRELPRLFGTTTNDVKTALADFGDSQAIRPTFLRFLQSTHTASSRLLPEPRAPEARRDQFKIDHADLPVNKEARISLG
jgi:hypothetical protein